MEIEIIGVRNSKKIATIKVIESTTIGDIKEELCKQNHAPYVERQSLRAEPQGKSLSDSETVESSNLRTSQKLYFKDLGPQISWRTVFLAEYAGPLFVYLWVYSRPWILYGETHQDPKPIVHYAAACWTIHYAKRLLETLFVHRFSHATMPLRNIFKNCLYYWGFTVYVAYHINHPQFTEPSGFISKIGLVMFAICEMGNLYIHLALRGLRPPGTKLRKIPIPGANPFTTLFNFVSCPNYTYEIGSWIGFTVMTNCLPAGLFALAGAYQMSVWALGKHRAYKKEFSTYPKERLAIIPGLL